MTGLPQGATLGTDYLGESVYADVMDFRREHIGDVASAMRETIAALDEISEDVMDAKRGTIADMVLGEYFA